MMISIEHYERKQIVKGEESAYDESQYLAEPSLSKRFGCGKVRKAANGVSDFSCSCWEYL
jgi:hypothetical protein